MNIGIVLLLLIIIGLIYKGIVALEKVLYQIRTILADINKSLNNGDYTGEFRYEDYYPNRHK